jgi:hypothetical protein
MLNPIHGDPRHPEPASLGPFTGLPTKIEAGEIKSFYFPYRKNCLLKEEIARIGVTDTYGRNVWCRRKDIGKARKSYCKDFGLTSTTSV